MYLPTKLDEPGAEDSHIYYGGINVYMEQKSGLWSKLPDWFQRTFDSRRLLNWAAGRSDMTKPHELGQMTLSMLAGEEGRQRRELDKLVEHLRDDLKPDLVCLSNVMLIGLAKGIRERLNVPVVCTLHGEDSFLDDLPAPYNERAWELLKQRAGDVDAFVAVSRYYGDVMRGRMDIADGRLHVVHNGISLDGYAPAAAANRGAEPEIGYLARMCWVKGIELLVDAFIELKKRDKLSGAGAKLRIAGSMTPQDEKLVKKLKTKLRDAGVADDVEFLPNVTRDEKIAFLQSLSLLSVPTRFDESFGLYLLEAWACGVPVVQPRRGAFPELIEATGGGVLCEPDSPTALADAWEELLLDPQRARGLGESGRRAVVEGFGVERMARDVMKVCEKLIDGRSEHQSSRTTEQQMPSGEHVRI
jgi:glycosyltransferase involved in cell wall biosynthesis